MRKITEAQRIKKLETQAWKQEESKALAKAGTRSD